MEPVPVPSRVMLPVPPVCMPPIEPAGGVGASVHVIVGFFAALIVTTQVVEPEHPSPDHVAVEPPDGDAVNVTTVSSA